MPPKNEPAGNGAAGTGDGNTPPAGNPEPQTPPTATPPKPEVPEGFELIRTEDKNKLISQRDKANNGNAETDAIVSSLMQKDAIRDAMAKSEFKDAYPDVTEADLLEMNPSSEEEIDNLAKARQARYEAVKQDTLKKVQRATAPTISQADKDTKLKELAKPAKTSRFAEALRLQRMQVK